MLELIRKRAQGWLAWVIVTLLIIPFALWGVNEYIDPNPETYVASVNGVDIPTGVYDQAYQAARARLQQTLGDEFSPDMLEQFGLRENVLENLIEEEVLVQTARDAGYRISDEQLGREIRNIGEFQADGQFDLERYQRMLRSQGETPASFEARVARLMLLNQLRGGIAGSAVVSDFELRNLVRLRDQQREISYLIVPTDRFAEEITVDEADIEAYYEDNSEQFARPEKVSVNYIELAIDDLARTIPVEEEQLRQLYEQRRAEFATEEQRRVSHILISFGDDPQTAEQRAMEVLKRVREGEPFEELAAEYSEDPGSSDSGGDLGFFGRGIMDSAFEEAAFALDEIGDVSDVVKSSFGFHIIKLTGIQAGSATPFEEVRDQLARDYRRRQAEELFFDQAELLANAAFEHPDTLDVAAELLGLEIRSTDLFERTSGDGIASHAIVRQAAFSDEVLGAGHNSELLEISPEHLIVLRIDEHQPSTIRPLEEVRDQIADRLRNERARERAVELGERLVAALEDGGDPAGIAEEHGLQWTDAGLISRDESDVNPAIVDTAFRLPRPADDDAPVYAGTTLENGNHAVIRLSAVIEGDIADLAETERRNLRETQLRTTGNLEQRLLIEGLVDRADIERFRTAAEEL